MTTIADVTEALPWGLHDAYLEGMDVDWLQRALSLRVRVMTSERQDMDRRATIRVRGLVFCSVDPPEELVREDPSTEVGLWIDSGEGPAPSAGGALPSAPPGCFVQWFFVHSWNQFIHVCAKHAELVWTEDAPVAARSGRRALYATK